MPRGGYRESNPGGRPPLPEGEKSKAVTFRLPPPIVERIKAKADAHGISQAKLITLAVDAYPPAPLPGDELQQP
jgi:hypothetical protein